MKTRNYIKFFVAVLAAFMLIGMGSKKNIIMAEKAKVLEMLPIMNAWKAAYFKWAETHNGLYTQGGNGEDGSPTAADLGVSWPSDWKCTDDSKTECRNDEWYCSPMADGSGAVTCATDYVYIAIYQIDSKFTCRTGLETFEGKTICGPMAKGSIGNKICKSLGGRMAKGCLDVYIIGE